MSTIITLFIGNVSKKGFEIVFSKELAEIEKRFLLEWLKLKRYKVETFYIIYLFFFYFYNLH